ncbi:OLC1v1010804C1 [Oldenlandia corymbosa var. corymbosa]|nr:OLC1v1010804C1 [Oldenlandia corymbosa var. corymbosa]
MWSSGSLVKKKDERQLISSSEYGEISSVGIEIPTDLSSYNIQSITMVSSAIFLPVVLSSDMVFYVQTGSGSLSYTSNEGRLQTRKLKQGDVFGLNPGDVFFIQSCLCTDKLQIHAIFGDLEEGFRQPAASGPYSSFRNMLLRFNKKILQETFKVSPGVIDELFNAPNPPAFVPAVSKTWELEANFIRWFSEGFLGDSAALFNILTVYRDSENRNGWITTSNKKKRPVEYLKGLLSPKKFGVFMANLSSGSMVAPHWNPMATEIAIVLQGKGMVRVVCSSLNNFAYEKSRRCEDTRFQVEEGDVFVVPRLHPTAQMSFGDDTFVFMGFSTETKMKKSGNHEFLVGKVSIFRALGRSVLAASLGVNETMINEILRSQLGESAVLGCNLCAEEELRIMEEEMEKAEQEETGAGEGEEEPGKEEVTPGEEGSGNTGPDESLWAED